MRHLNDHRIRVQRRTAPHATRKRPFGPANSVTRIRILFLRHHIEYLDFVVALVDLRRRLAISRDQCLCALIEFARRMKIDVASCRSAEELTALLVKRFRKFPHRLRNPPVRF